MSSVSLLNDIIIWQYIEFTQGFSIEYLYQGTYCIINKEDYILEIYSIYLKIQIYWKDRVRLLS